jgi:hypothetical protein
MDVPIEKLQKAFEDIRRDIAFLHRDQGYGAGNETRWIFIIMWVVTTNLVHDLFGLGAIFSLIMGTLIVGAYRFLDGWRIGRRALRVMKEPLEPHYETKVDLS